MKILAIRGENITSLKEFSIDFKEEPLKSAGLFAICGPTGSGKSSLLDTMCLALFNKVPRLEGAGKGAQGVRFESKFGSITQEDVKLMIRRGSQTCSAEVDFLGLDGNEYRARWGYRLAKKAGSDPKEEFSLICLNDQQVHTENTKGKHFEKLEKLIGLNYEQFSRTVFLSQGKFADFLKSDENVRSDLLEKITGTSIYTDISIKIFERNRIETGKLNDLNSQLNQLSILPPEKINEISNNVKALEKGLQKHYLARESMKNVSSAIGKWQMTTKDLNQLSADIDKNTHSITLERKIFDTLIQELNVIENSQKELEPLLEQVLSLDKELAVQKQQRIDAEENVKKAEKTWGDLNNEKTLITESIVKEQKNIKTLEKWLEDNKKIKILSDDWGRYQHIFKDCGISVKNQRVFSIGIAQDTKRLNELKKIVENLNDELKKLNIELGEGAGQDLPTKQVQLAEGYKAIIECKEYILLQNEYKKVVSLNEACIKNKTQADIDLIAAENDFKAKDQMYTLTLKVSGESAESLRAELKEGEECPVCGAKEHPYINNHSFKTLLTEHKLMRDKSLKYLGDAKASALSWKQQYEETGKKIDSLKNGIKNKTVPTSVFYIKIKSLEEDAQINIINQEVLENKKSTDEFSLKISINKKVIEKEKQLQEKIADKRTLEVKIERDQKDLDTEMDRYKDLAKHLDEAYEGNEWRIKWQASPDEFLGEQELAVAQYLKNQTSLQESKSRQVLNEEKKNDLQVRIPKAKEELDGYKAVGTGLKDTEYLKENKRLELFGTKDVKKVREDNAIMKANKTKFKDEALIALQNIENANSALIGEQKSKTKEIQLLINEIKTQASIISVNGNDFVTHDWNNLNAESYTGYKKTIDSVFPELEEKIEKDYNEKVNYLTQIRQQEKTKLESEKIHQLISLQKPIQEKWNKLNIEIGSSNGQVFRKIAQAYTLETLLFYANTQLAQITKRFQLQKIGDAGHFGVLDQDNYGDLRPIHTLSGGETFIVSLAMALGLSAMSSNGITIESLFIDEGFGTLDPETLKCVMGALSQLQAQGRKVGLITHVEEMKEQIPSRIEVSKNGMGASSVRIVGQL